MTTFANNCICQLLFVSYTKTLGILSESNFNKSVILQRNKIIWMCSYISHFTTLKCLNGVHVYMQNARVDIKAFREGKTTLIKTSSLCKLESTLCKFFPGKNKLQVWSGECCTRFVLHACSVYPSLYISLQRRIQICRGWTMNMRASLFHESAPVHELMYTRATCTWCDASAACQSFQKRQQPPSSALFPFQSRACNEEGNFWRERWCSPNV